MKQSQILIIAALALLTACGGGQTQNQNTAASDTTAINSADCCTETQQKPSVILAEMQKDGEISDTAKRFFEAIHFQDPAELNDENGCYVWENGFTANFKNGEWYEFRVYNQSDGKQIAIMTKEEDGDEHFYELPETSFWSFDGTTADTINYSLPLPAVEEFSAWKSGDHSLIKDQYHLYIHDTFIQYEAKSTLDKYDGYEDPECFLRYDWDGEKFVYLDEHN